MKRLLDIPARPDPQLVAQFAGVATAQLSDSMDRLYAASPDLRPMHRGGVLAGPAFTEAAAGASCNFSRSASRALEIAGVSAWCSDGAAAGVAWG